MLDNQRITCAVDWKKWWFRLFCTIQLRLILLCITWVELCCVHWCGHHDPIVVSYSIVVLSRKLRPESNEIASRTLYSWRYLPGISIHKTLRVLPNIFHFNMNTRCNRKILCHRAKSSVNLFYSQIIFVRHSMWALARFFEGSEI